MPSEFGVMSELYAYISFLNVFLTYGMETSFFRHYEMSENKHKIFSTSFISLLVSSIIFICIIYYYSAPIAGLIRYSNHVEYIVWLALIVALDAVATIPFAKLRADNRPKFFAGIKLINIGFNIGFNLFFLIICPYILKTEGQLKVLKPFIDYVYNSNIGVGYVFISNLIASVLTFILLLPMTFKIKLDFDKKIWKEMMIYALPLLVAGLAGIVNETIDRILLKFLLPEGVSMAQVGIYSACYKISLFITIFIQAFRFAADPFFFSQAKNKDAKAIYASVMNYFVITCLSIFLVIMLYIDIVKHFVGTDYYEGLKVVPILLMANVFLGVFYNLSIWYKLSGKTIYGAYLSIFGAVITLIMNFLWIPVWGYIGAAWATLICYFAMMIASYIVGQKHYNVNYNVRKSSVYFLLALGLYFVSLLVEPFVANYKLFVNTLFLGIFFYTIYKIEKKNIRLHPSEQ